MMFKLCHLRIPRDKKTYVCTCKLILAYEFKAITGSFFYYIRIERYDITLEATPYIYGG